ncbi:GNAT family N-acetyltransferase [Polymorphospora sp. NPDC051019]|uniref:GNAT family N-acetyltransferase n=1 Tax=unclassified Polymorphospora TaxID=2685497 RepID=UPI0034274D41
MTEVIFRTARRADVPAIVALLADDPLGAGREAAGGDAGGTVVGEEVDAAYWRAVGDIDAAYWRAFDDIDADPRNALVVADLAGEVVGTMQLTFIPGLSRLGAERAQIEAVRVRADQRGAGLGRRMISWAVDEARARGCRLVQLTTDKRRADAHRFYAGLGFEASHEGMKLAL